MNKRFAKGMIVGASAGMTIGFLIGVTSFWYSPDNQEVRAAAEYRIAREYFPPYDGPVEPVPVGGPDVTYSEWTAQREAK